MPQDAQCPVLLIEDEPDAAKLVRYVLSKDNHGLVLDWATDLRTGLQRLAQQDFQAVLLDLNLPDSTGFQTFARLRQEYADRAVIVLTGVEDEHLALQAVRAGADEYLLKTEIRQRFLSQRIRFAIERKRIQRQNAGKGVRHGKIFGFIGAKGGVGTTTLVLNLAAALAKLGKSVLAVELVSGYGSFAAHLRHSPVWNSAALFETPPESILPQQIESSLTDLDCGFRVLFGPQKVEEYRDIPPGAAGALLRTAVSLADDVLVDLPACFPPYLREVVECASFMTLVLEKDWLCRHAASVKLPLLKSAGVREEAYGVAIVNKTPHVELFTAQELARQLGCPTVAVIPPAGDLLASNRSAAPVYLTAAQSAFTECIHDAARRFCGEPVRFLQF
jgi:CheY-like chemotaxis protein